MTSNQNQKSSEKNKQKNRSKRSIQITLDMLYSNALQDLNAPTIKILWYALFQFDWVNLAKHGEKARYVPTYATPFQLLYSTFKNSPFNMKPGTITRSIDSLLAHGFIKVTEQGGRCYGHQSKYRYIESWKNWKEGDVLNKRQPFFARGFTNNLMKEDD